MTTLDQLAVSAYVVIRNAAVEFWRDQRGASVSTVLLIAVLVVAIAIFGGIVAAQIGVAGNSVNNVDFSGNN